MPPAPWANALAALRPTAENATTPGRRRNALLKAHGTAHIGRNGQYARDQESAMPDVIEGLPTMGKEVTWQQENFPEFIVKHTVPSMVQWPRNQFMSN